MIRSRTIALGLASTVLTSLAMASGDQWHADFDSAAKLAREQNKNLLVDFTGSDWCGWCIRLDKEVFAHEEFLTAAQEHFVLTALDFPQGDEAKAKVPNPERNGELRDKYRISGFPTVLLITPDGDVFGSTGYKEGGPEAYVKHLTELRTTGLEQLGTAKKLVAEFSAAEGDAKLALFDKIAEAMQSTGGHIADLYVPSIKTAMAMDASGEKGLRTRALNLLLDSGRADNDVIEMALEMDPKNEQGLFQKAVLVKMDAVNTVEDVKSACQLIDRFAALGEIKDAELAKKVYINAAWWNHQVLENADAAKTYATKAKGLLGDDDARIMDMLDTILGSK